jgi:hypothetical protein
LFLKEHLEYKIRYWRCIKPSQHALELTQPTGSEKGLATETASNAPIGGEYGGSSPDSGNRSGRAENLASSANEQAAIVPTG